MQREITVWLVRTSKEGQEERWEHNHISDDYDPNQTTPSVKFPSQNGWKNLKWKAIKADLIDGNVVIRE